MKRKYLIFTIILLLIGFNANGSFIHNTKKVSTISFNGSILYVGGSGPNNYTKIQDAIDNASDGETVFIYDDSSPYFENVEIGRSIAIIGENKTTTSINWEEEGDIIHITAEGVSIHNLTIKDGKQDGIGVYANNTVISYNVVENNRYGIHLQGSDYNHIHHNTILDNRNGINIYESSNNDITNNSIFNNFHYGIYLGNSWYNKIQKNSLSFHMYSINIDDSGNNVISSNIITGNPGSGISFYDSTNITVHNNSFWNSGITMGGYTIHCWDTHVIENNYANDKPIYYYKNNHTGVEIPSNAALVILANCTFVKINSLNTSWVDTGIILGFSHHCEISETRSNNNNYGISLVRSHKNMIHNCSFSDNTYGVAIWSSTNTTISTSNFFNNSREGIHLVNATNTYITDNNISENIQGLYLNEVYHSTITNNHFFKNTLESIYSITTVHNSSISENVIRGNSGKGIELGYSRDNMISGNTICDNNETGIHVISCYNNTISKNVVKNNSNGISMSYARDSTISMNHITKNRGKGISVVYSYNTQITNNNIIENNPNAYFLSYGSHEIDGLRIKGFFQGVWNSLRITFNGNYWGRPRLFPVLITGKIISFGYPAWIGDIEYKWWKFDWHPAKEPYEIGEVL